MCCKKKDNSKATVDCWLRFWNRSIYFSQFIRKIDCAFVDVSIWQRSRKYMQGLMRAKTTLILLSSESTVKNDRSCLLFTSYHEDTKTQAWAFFLLLDLKTHCFYRFIVLSFYRFDFDVSTNCYVDSLIPSIPS